MSPGPAWRTRRGRSRRVAPPYGFGSRTGDLGVGRQHVDEALERTGRQAVSAYCGLSGVCGVVPALGSCYSVLVGAQCGKGPETQATMTLVSRLAAVTAEEAGRVVLKTRIGGHRLVSMLRGEQLPRICRGNISGPASPWG